MILRLSDTLSKKIKLTPTELVPLNANPFADWSCHSFTAGRTQFIIAANTASLYAVVFPGRRVTRHAHLESSIFSQLQASMMADGFEFLYKRLIDVEGDTVSYSRPLTPALGAAVNDLAELAAYYIEENKLRVDEVAARINGSPLSTLEHSFPRDAFRALSFQK